MKRNTEILIVMGAISAFVALGALAGVGIVKASLITEAQKSHIAQIQKPFAYEGKDGFAALYAIGRDVPKHDQENVLLRDAASFHASIAQKEDRWESALSQYPDIMPKQTDATWCTFKNGQSCLEAVRTDPEHFIGLVQTHAIILEQANALAKFDHFKSPFGTHSSYPVPNYRPLGWLPTQSAALFVQGKTDQGLAGACRGIKTGRDLMGGGDILIGSMIGADMSFKNATLLTEMMAEIPPEHSLPIECKDAFASDISASDMVCRGLMSEGKFAIGGYFDGSMKDAATSDAVDHFFDEERTAARIAYKFNQYCEKEGAQVANAPFLAVKPLPLLSADCATNYVGCIIADTGDVQYQHYANRILDAAAVLNLTAQMMKASEDGIQFNPDQLSNVFTAPGGRSLDIADGQVHMTLFSPSNLSKNQHQWTAHLPGEGLKK